MYTSKYGLVKQQVLDRSPLVGNCYIDDNTRLPLLPVCQPVRECTLVRSPLADANTSQTHLQRLVVNQVRQWLIDVVP
jgi:hypothetical protein